MAALRIHQHRIERQRRAFPFPPLPLDAPGQIGAIGALQHQPFNRRIPRAITQRLQIADLLEGNDVGKIHPLRLLALIPVFQPRAPH